MPRWFIALLYALMLACAGLPASGYALASLDEGSGQGCAVTALADELPDSTPASDEAGDETETEPGSAAEIPELFTGPLPVPLAVLPTLAPVQRASQAGPPPFLEGPQRPPRLRRISGRA